MSLLLLGCLIIGSSLARADSYFSSSPYTTFISNPSLKEPYIRVRLMFYDCDSWDSFFTHAKTEGNNKGPAVYVDGKYICSPDWELAWPDGDGDAGGTGAGNAVKTQCTNNDGWWGSTYTKTIDGVTYTVKFWNPVCNSTDQRYVDMFVFVNKLLAGQTHTVKVKGMWRINKSGGGYKYLDWQEKTFTTNAFSSLGVGSPTAEMTGYGKMKISGNLKSDYGPTTIGTYKGANSSDLPWSDKLTTSGTYNKGLSSFSNLELDFEERSDYYNQQTKHVEYIITDQISYGGSTMPEVKIYQWYVTYVPGYIRAKNLAASTNNMWTKEVKLTWSTEGSNNSSNSKGTWNVYRYPKGKASARECIISNLSASTSSSTVTAPDYDKPYTYEVSFIPSDDKQLSELTRSIDFTLARAWAFTNNGFSAKVNNIGDAINLAWAHNSIGDASSTNAYSLEIQRSTDQTNWEVLDHVSINSSQTTDGTFTDRKELEPNRTYYYRLKLNIMGVDKYSSIVSAKLGGSKIKEFIATRGTYNNMVKLQWTVQQVGSTITNFIIQRRPLGSNDESAWADIHSTSGTASGYSYDDVTALPGSFNEYKVIVWSQDGDKRSVDDQATADGFSLATGVVSGRVTYGTGMAVDSVKVMLKQQTADGDLASGMHSVRLSGQGSGMKYATDNEKLKSLLSGNFTIQMYLNPNNVVMKDNNTDYRVFDVEWALTINAKYDANNQRYKLNGYFGGGYFDSQNVYIPAGEWSHMTLVHDTLTKTLTFYLTQAGKTQKEVVMTGKTTDWSKSANADCIAIGNVGQFNASTPFDGHIDEFRFFTRALTEGDILRNYNHPLAGNETGLAIYYPFDEGLKDQTIAYDFSKTNGVTNGRHATAKVAAEGSEYVPSEDKLSLMAYTDNDGNYTIRGVPFTGEGTSYSVVPTLGIHEFSPSARSRFVSMSSLNHSGVDFEDVSSFPVKGKVYYADTDYPVEGVNFYVDGTICSKSGEIIATNEKGEFTISVPIGDHFIRAEKSGHVFANNGRYPADPNNVGILKNFNDSIPNMEFHDETLVNFTGRVVGGSIQGEKPVGFGLSTNNIGVTELVLTPLNDYRLNVVKEKTETAYNIVNNPDIVPVASATDKIKSSAYRKGGPNRIDCQQVIIDTDPETGEFSAMLPPLQFNVGAMKLKKTGDEVGESTTIDLTDPNVVQSDTLYNEDGDDYELYEYNTILKQTYHTPAVFNVKQEGREDGSFGIDSYTLTDELGDLEINDIYTVNNGKVNYKYYESSIFVKGDPYTFLIEGYEPYTNVDNNVEDRVPLEGSVVTISNALSSEQKVYFQDVDGHAPGETDGLQENQLALDNEGKAIYKWKAGLPNIAKPYSRTISMTYEINDRSYPWSGNGMKGIILGELPTGSNFITAGPEKVSMVLRDPPGTNSFTEWKSGTTKTVTTVTGTTFNQNSSASFKHRFGFDKAIVIGTGVATVESIESCNDLEIGAKMEYENESSKTVVETTSITKTITTSAAPEYVGAQGDVFIGNSTNILFGKVRNVGFHRIDGGNTADIALDDIIQTGLDFGTMFMYTQNYIENVMLPNYELLRKKFLQTTTQDKIDSYVNNTDHTVYLTTLSPNDKNFGADNTYTIFKSPNVSYASDSVAWINMQIENWQNCLKDNEREKVLAFKDRKKHLLGDNISFDSGTSYNYEWTEENDTTTTRDWTIKGGVVIDDTWGLAISGFGFNVHLTDETLGGEHHVTDTLDVITNTFSYTLAEDGDDDALSVDVLKYGSFSPIFHTRAGQTCCPYEGEVRTKYYTENGSHPIIMEGTMQIEVPQIEVDVPVMSDVPTGSTANFTLRLSNASEIDEDVYYRLLVDDETNPNGANLMIDGKPVTDSRVIKVPAGQTVTKALQLKQTNISILDYDSIAVVLASQCQYDPTSTWAIIADTVYVSAHFVPSSSTVDLALSTTTMNTQTGTNLTLTFSGFDRNYKGLKAFRLQYKKQGSTDWTLLKEYVLNKADSTANNLMLPPSGSSVSYMLPMAAFSDGNYMFRVVSASTYGTDEVYRYSDELTLVKDMQRPTPLGLPEPSDGILDAGDEISVTFNETILKGELTKEANLRVTGVLNGSEIAHETALSMKEGETTAATEANFTLAGKDFSTDMWVNLQGAGTILSHGTGVSKMTVGTDTDGKLVVTFGGQTYASDNTIPTGKWVFLTLNYLNTDTGGALSASVASDTETTSLFMGIQVDKYEGAGPLAVGKNLKGAIHELLLWDEAHDITTALMNRSITKSPSTRHLIGYWKMDEGEGTEIRDYARNRHMKMADETWYLNNENKALELDGSHYVAINTSELDTYEGDDYALEFWMRGDKQAGEAQLAQAGDVALWAATDGTLQLTGKGAYKPADQTTTLATASGDILDKAWHHIALNILRQGAAAVYVDGKRVLTTSASNVGSIASDKLLIGTRRTTFSAETAEYSFDRVFKGQVDEVRIWSASMNADMLAKQRKVRLRGNEDGLAAYFPFEIKTLDDYNQVITLGSDSCLTGSDVKAQLLKLNAQPDSLIYSDEAPALRTKPTETNVNFNFTASDNKVVIDIDENPAIIEGCTLNFTVRDARDVNGNYSDPIVWSAFINRNELVWADDVLSVTQEVKSESSLTATIVNKGGKQQMWTLSGMPSWLQASSEYGTTNPLAETSVTFTVSPATPIGKYEETVYLKGNDGIETPLTISVKVTGKVPEWSVNPKDFEFSMNVIGRVEVKSVPMDDEDDIIAAFIGEECRGIAHPVYKERYDGSYITMDIYGNDDRGKEVTFRAFDASTGTLYPVVEPDRSITFEPLALIGKYDAPVVFSVVDLIEQSTDLKAGWNWLSLYATPSDMSVAGVFEKIADDVITVKSQTQWAMNENGTWKGELKSLTNDQMYAVQLKADRKLRIVGQPVNPEECQIIVKKNWNWIGYYGRQVASIGNALAGMEPVNGDILKGQSGVTYFDDYEWAGSLPMMEPGIGYMLKSTTDNDRLFNYSPSIVAAARSLTPTTPEAVSLLTYFSPVNFRNYANNAIMTVKLTAAGKALSNMELGVFADDECRTAALTNSEGFAYLTIPGDDVATLAFKVAIGDKVFEASKTVNYEVDGVYGSPDSPLVIDLGEATGIWEILNGDNDASVYDLQGRKVDLKDNRRKLSKGVYIINGQKKTVK